MMGNCILATVAGFAMSNKPSRRLVDIFLREMSDEVVIPIFQRDGVMEDFKEKCSELIIEENNNLRIENRLHLDFLCENSLIEQFELWVRSRNNDLR